MTMSVAGWDTVCDFVLVHAFTSVTVTVYVPAASPVRLASVEPLFHKKTCRPLPPVIAGGSAPVEIPLHTRFVTAVVMVTGPGVVTTSDTEAVHPWLSVTVNIYVSVGTPAI